VSESSEHSALAPSGEAYRYRNPAPLWVLGLALLAAGGVVGLAGGAHAAVRTATEADRLADPPDLMRAMDAAASRGMARFNDTAI
jgi:hypothetical protein